jgi:6-pyruvoyltetrahydropterin/6-carboxytetrahydropterin synthase
MYTIGKKFKFSASHVLKGLPEGHKCARLHGHNYEVELVFRAPLLDARGFVVDYGDFHPFKDYIDEKLDHRHLNEALEMDSPTAEKIAEHLFDVALDLDLGEVYAVRVSETPDTWAEYKR